MRKLLIVLLFAAATSAVAAEPPETILSYLYPKEGSEAALEAALHENVAILKKLDVIEPAPVVIVRAKDAKERTYFVHIFTWRSASIPDDAPAEIKKNWKLLESLCERRDGKRGIEFTPVDVVVK